MTNRHVFITALVTLTLFVSSCDQEQFFFEAKVIEQGEWPLDYSPFFSFNTTDTSSYLDFYLDIRNNEKYRYRNIYTFIDMTFPNGRQLKDTIHFPNMATSDGAWTGKGIGGSYDNSILYKSRKKLPLPGDYKIKVTHAMRDTVLVGIEKVGIHIDLHNAK
ncbi:MAG: gliding motility lipoprotein GldH [Flavobacteriales bacterium]|nr:gliding motility lipoprotein GldH [Flavobacteriales bacterium]NNK80332.1 gliding motility lipoprotein GldH [Flavobacteriales bacterium]